LKYEDLLELYLKIQVVPRRKHCLDYKNRLVCTV